MNERTTKIVMWSLLGFFLVGGGGVIYYLQGVLDERRATEQTVQAELEDAELKSSKVQGLEELIKGNPEKNIPGLKNELAAAEERVPPLDEKEYDELLNTIDNLRKLSSTFISDAKYSMPRTTGGAPTIAKVTYDLQMRGGFFNLLRFINLLESQTRFISVAQFTITEGSDEQRRTGLVPIREMKLSLHGFTRRGPGARPADKPDPAAAPATDRVATTPLP